MSGFVAQTGHLLSEPAVRRALLAAALLGLVAGVLGPLITARNMAFSVHATSEVAFTGGAAALLVGASIGAGALAAAVVTALTLGVLSVRNSERDSVIGAVLTFGLGVGVFLLWLYPGPGEDKLELLTGHIGGVDAQRLVLFAVSSLAVLAVLALIYRPLLFASVDPDVAAARGVPVRLLSPTFAVLIGVVAALGVQTVGSLLVVGLMITPGAAAVRLAAGPLRATVLSVVFAEVAMIGGLVLSLAPGIPAGAFVTALSFAIYLVSRVISATRRHLAFG